MEKIRINMLARRAEDVKGQGVGSAYLEQVNLLKEAKDLFEIVINDTKKADIVHAHTIDPINYLEFRKSTGVKVAYVHFLPHTLDGSIHLPKPIFRVFKKYVIRFYKKADYLVVVNPIFKKDLMQYHIPEEKIKYIPNYVSKEHFCIKADARLKIREKLHIPKDAFVVMGAGQVQTRKGVLDFVEVAKKMPAITFLWCGGFSFGKITDGYEELKKVYENPPKNVRFLGIVPREEMCDILNASDLFFLPSYNELFPMTILEASNVHVPLLLRNLELYEDILFHKYASGETILEFVDLINSFKENPELLEKYKKYSKEISEYYSKEHVLEMWISFYKGIIKEKVK